MAGPTQATNTNSATDTVGSAPSVSGLTANEKIGNLPRKIAITLTSVAVTWTDNGASGGYGSLKIYDMPEGVVCVLAANLKITAASWSAGMGATATSVVFSVGSAAEATGATLDSTQANICPSVSAGTLAASAVAAAFGTQLATPTNLNGTATAIDVYLNIASDGTDSTAGGTVTVSGTLEITYIPAGDR